jgi:hypothetical protein
MLVLCFLIPKKKKTRRHTAVNSNIRLLNPWCTNLIPRCKRTCWLIPRTTHLRKNEAVGDTRVVGAKWRKRICVLLGILPTAIRTRLLPYIFPKFPSVPAWKWSTTVYFQECAYACSLPQGNKRLTLILQKV